MKSLLILGLFFLLFSCTDELYDEHKDSTRGYSSWLPAASPEHAMLLGNGNIGALVYGHPHQETIIMSHASIYLPTGIPKQPIDQAGRLDEIRQLLLDGKGEKAAKIPVQQSLLEGYGGQIWSDPYIPAFDILIKTTPANIEKYQRSVNFESGEAIVEWIQDGILFERRQFISRPDSLMIIKLTADTVFDVEFIFRQRPVKWNEWDYIHKNIKSTRSFARGANLFYQSEFTHQWEGNISGYQGVGKVISANGTMEFFGSSIKVSNTNEAVLLVKIKPYNTGESPKTELLEQQLDEVVSGYDELLKAHKNIHTEIYNRVTLDLHADEDDKRMTSEVAMQTAKDSFRTAFVEKQFNAARYNILSATGLNPPNLQGIWGINWQPPWSSDFTHDGNLPVSISSFLCSNMPELMLSYFDYHDSRLSDYRDNAQKLYGCRGIQVPSHSSTRGWNVHFDPTWCLTFWNGGAAWAAHFYYDYWLYTRDKLFLKNRAYPFMKEAALFFEDFLTIGKDGKYIFNPSYSPENNPANYPSQATINATMDVMLVNELLRNLIAAAKVLRDDEDQIRKWETMLSKLPAYEVTSSGSLREWLWEGYQENHKHRHLSHLYGMYDMIDPELANNEELLKGVKKVVEERMKVRREEEGGIMVFGLVQLAWVAANLGDGALVQDIIQMLSAHYWSNSLATYHDPNGLFNMDLSGGFQTVVIRSLVYSEPGLLTILPAKPPAWEQGSIGGILVRNQIIIKELVWNKDEIHLRLKSEISQEIVLKFPSNTYQIKVMEKHGNIKGFDRGLSTSRCTLPAGKEVYLTLKLN